MKEEKKIEFTQKWIGDAVKKLLQKEDIYESDMERSVYSSKKKQLVIAPLTAEEFYNGQAEYFEQRINAVCPGQDYKFFRAGICPYCGTSNIQSSKTGFTIKDYCACNCKETRRHDNGLKKSTV